MKKIIQIGGNLRINGISSFIMTLYHNLNTEYQFVFINTAKGNDYYRDEILFLGGKIDDVVVKGKGIIRAMRQAKEIRKIIREEQPCAVHSHYFSNNGLYLKQAYLEGVPVRISHCHQSNPKMLKLGKRIAKWLSSKMINKYATRKFACSDVARKFLYSANGEICYNAISYDKFGSKKNISYSQFGLEPHKKYFLFVGRFSEQKNTDFLLKLFEEIKCHEEVVLLMVGHGAKQKEIEVHIKKNALFNVVLLPANSDVASLLCIATAFLLPSLYEGLPITLIEAQATGTHCIVSDKVTEEVQLGLIDYLPLDVDVWKEKILYYASHLSEKEGKKSNLFDDKMQSAIFKGIYDGIKSDEWITHGKEYAIGSKSKYRSKFLAQTCFEQAHRLGDLRGSFYYALGFFEGNGVAKDTAKAESIVSSIIDEIEKNQCKMEYALILADMYSFGFGKPNDYKQASKLYLQSAEQGNLEAMCDLGYMFQVGQGVQLDLAQSAKWYKKSADLGYVHSMRDVGQSFLHGLGVEKNEKEAVRYFQFARESNYSHGTGDLAYCYLRGIGVEKDEQKAMELYQLALRQDDERTMRDLFSIGIDIDELKNQNKIKFLCETEIISATINNTYAGTLCVSAKINHIDPKCFYSSEIKKFFVEKENPYYCAQKGVLFSKKKSILVRFAPKSDESVYTVPDFVQEIGAHAFQNCRKLKKIVLSNCLTKISESAFDDCKELEAIVIPTTVEQIGAWAFHGCDKIEHIVIPASVKEIGKYAFGSCESLSSIIVDADNSQFCSIDGNLYNKNITTLLQYSIAKPNEVFSLPNSVKIIAFRAISDAQFLKTVMLNNVVRVEEKAFYYSTSLSKIILGKDVKIGVKAFENTSPNLQVEVTE